MCTTYVSSWLMLSSDRDFLYLLHFAVGYFRLKLINSFKGCTHTRSYTQHYHVLGGASGLNTLRAA